MDFNLSPKHQLMRTMFHDFAIKHVKLAAEIDEEERFPTETLQKMVEAKMMGIPFAQEWGGAGADTLTYILAVEELSKVCATTGVIYLHIPPLPRIRFISLVQLIKKKRI